jgi:antitoxin MazE
MVRNYKAMPPSGKWRAVRTLRGRFTMRVAVRKFGNSSGVIIPKSVLAEVGVSVGDAVGVTLEKGCIVLAPLKRRPRVGWAKASQAIVRAGDDVLVWPEFGDEIPECQG